MIDLIKHCSVFFTFTDWVRTFNKLYVALV